MRTNIAERSSEYKNMKIEFRKITDVHPYEANPRHNDGAVEAVADWAPHAGFDAFDREAQLREFDVVGLAHPV